MNISKILIANRGEIAVRVIRACQEMGIATVAVHSDVERGAMHVHLADEAYEIGGAAPAQSYLRSDKVLEVARQSGADAIHPGYGFLSENEDFAEAVAKAGLVFIGPRPEVIASMGSKTAARRAMEAAGVPVVPGFNAKDEPVETLAAQAERIGYPIMIKAVAGGGGKGMRLVEDPARFADAAAGARREALAAFGDGAIYLEKAIVRPRHIEVQVAADHHGNVVHLFERECSIQRRHQKVVEETPSTALTPALRAQICEAAVRAAEAVGYTSVGTVEFLMDESGAFYFLEMNTRLQVEHPITEFVAGVDLVKTQIRIARGEPLPFLQQDLTQRGHAIECRLYAEDTEAGFLPSTGPLLRFDIPAGYNIRVDRGFRAGDEVTIHYDPMLAKLIVYARTREEAIDKMRWALDHFVVHGVETNIDFLTAVVVHEAFRRGDTTTAFIEEHFKSWAPSAEDPPPEVLIAAALFDRPEGDEAIKWGLRAFQSSKVGASLPWDLLGRWRMGE